MGTLEENDLDDLVLNAIEEPTSLMQEGLPLRSKQRQEELSMTQSRRP